MKAANGSLNRDKHVYRLPLFLFDCRTKCISVLISNRYIAIYVFVAIRITMLLSKFETYITDLRIALLVYNGINPSKILLDIVF
jgi:hypothetical protein